MKAYVIHCDDGSILYEWVGNHRRFGIAIELKPEDSGWYFIDKDGTIEGGELPKELLDLLKK